MSLAPTVQNLAQNWGVEENQFVRRNWESIMFTRHPLTFMKLHYLKMLTISISETGPIDLTIRSISTTAGVRPKFGLRLLSWRLRKGNWGLKNSWLIFIISCTQCKCWINLHNFQAACPKAVICWYAGFAASSMNGNGEIFYPKLSFYLLASKASKAKSTSFYNFLWAFGSGMSNQKHHWELFFFVRI